MRNKQVSGHRTQAWPATAPPFHLGPLNTFRICNSYSSKRLITYRKQNKIGVPLTWILRGKELPFAGGCEPWLSEAMSPAVLPGEHGSDGWRRNLGLVRDLVQVAMTLIFAALLSILWTNSVMWVKKASLLWVQILLYVTKRALTKTRVSSVICKASAVPWFRPAVSGW